jgi:hypothetical protein
MSNLSYEKHSQRDFIVVSVLRDVLQAVRLRDGEMDAMDEVHFNNLVRDLSDEARRQVTEEVRQVLLLLEKLNKKRVM